MMSGDDESNDSPPPSEVLWWGNEDEQGSDPIKQKEEVVSEFESEVSISTKEGPTLTGEVRAFPLQRMEIYSKPKMKLRPLEFRKLHGSSLD